VTEIFLQFWFLVVMLILLLIALLMEYAFLLKMLARLVFVYAVTSTRLWLGPNVLFPPPPPAANLVVAWSLGLSMFIHKKRRRDRL